MNQHSINTNIHEATHFIHFHLTLVPSIPLPSPPDNAVISTAKKPCEGCHGFKPPSFSAKKVVWSPDFPLTKTDRFKISASQWYAMEEAPLESDGLLWGCTCLNLRSLHPTRLPNGNMARELSGRSTSCLGFGMAGNSAWRIYGPKWGNFEMTPVCKMFLANMLFAISCSWGLEHLHHRARSSPGRNPKKRPCKRYIYDKMNVILSEDGQGGCSAFLPCLED